MFPTERRSKETPTCFRGDTPRRHVKLFSPRRLTPKSLHPIDNLRSSSISAPFVINLRTGADNRYCGGDKRPRPPYRGPPPRKPAKIGQ